MEFEATYGKFNEIMEAEKVIDVTNIVSEQFLLGNHIQIKPGTSFNKLFTDPSINSRKFLQIKTAGRTYNIVEDHYAYDINIDLLEKGTSIKLVYYVFINRNSNWRNLISGQLLQLKSYGLLDEVDLYVHITDQTNFFDDVVDLIKSIHSYVIVSTSSSNFYEFPGIRKVYDLATEYPDDILIYLHTKGMSYNVQERKKEEIAILKGTFENWRKCLEGFQDPEIMKLGLFPAVEGLKVKRQLGARGGWVWFNFWYARGNYILTCDPPEIKGDRYYFEDWLGGKQDDMTIARNDCFNIYDRTGQRYFTGQEAHIELNFLIEEL
jgi:hypothetical protein